MMGLLGLILICFLTSGFILVRLAENEFDEFDDYFDI
jgi:hypothetical protein